MFNSICAKLVILSFFHFHNYLIALVSVNYFVSHKSYYTFTSINQSLFIQFKLPAQEDGISDAVIKNKSETDFLFPEVIYI